MIDISQFINQINSAVYGAEVRTAIVNALLAVHDENVSLDEIKVQVRADKVYIDEQMIDFGQDLETAKETLADLIQAISDASVAEQSIENETASFLSTIRSAISEAETTRTNLQKDTASANTAKTQLNAVIKDSETAKSNLQGTIDSGKSTDTTLKGTITNAGTAKGNLEKAITDAGTAKTSVEGAITDAGTAKTDLQTTTTNANKAKTDLQTEITNAGEANSTLSGTVEDAEDVNTTLEGNIGNANTLNNNLIAQNNTATEKISQLDAKLSDADEVLTGVEDIKAYLGYTDEDIVGLQVDYANNVFHRLAGAYGKNAGADFDNYEMFGMRRRCNVADDGTIKAFYGESTYTEDGSNGQVMVYQPAFYYKVVPLVIEKNTVSGRGYHLRKANYYISTREKTGFKLHPAFRDKNGNPVDYILMGAYEGSMYDVSSSVYVNDGVDTATAIETGDLLCSVSGKKPISGLKKNLTKANLELMAQNRGSDWHLETIAVASMNQLMMIIELGTMNTQTAIGNGVTGITDNSAYNCGSLTGSTSALGNGTGQAASTINEIGGVETAYNTNGKVSVSYRGLENPWGNLWKHINGVNIWGDGSMGGGQPFICSDFNFNESKNNGNYQGAGFTIANAGGYVKAMGYGSEEFDWLFFPSDVGGTSALPVGDYFYCTTDLNGYRVAQLGGYWYSGSSAGGFCWSCNSGVGYRNRAIGGRLLYVPTATVVIQN